MSSSSTTRPRIRTTVRFTVFIWIRTRPPLPRGTLKESHHFPTTDIRVSRTRLTTCEFPASLLPRHSSNPACKPANAFVNPDAKLLVNPQPKRKTARAERPQRSDVRPPASSNVKPHWKPLPAKVSVRSTRKRMRSFLYRHHKTANLFDNRNWKPVLRSTNALRIRSVIRKP